jgi:hypothetical protein
VRSRAHLACCRRCLRICLPPVCWPACSLPPSLFSLSLSLSLGFPSVCVRRVCPCYECPGPCVNHHHAMRDGPSPGACMILGCARSGPRVSVGSTGAQSSRARTGADDAAWYNRQALLVHHATTLRLPNAIGFVGRTPTQGGSTGRAAVAVAQPRSRQRDGSDARSPTGTAQQQQQQYHVGAFDFAAAAAASRDRYSRDAQPPHSQTMMAGARVVQSARASAHKAEQLQQLHQFDRQRHQLDRQRQQFDRAVRSVTGRPQPLRAPHKVAPLRVPDAANSGGWLPVHQLVLRES